MLDLTQWKSQKKAVSSGNRLLPQNKNIESFQDMHKKTPHGPQSPTWYYTPQIFNLGSGPVMSSWTALYQRLFMQWIFLQCTQMMWLSLLKPSWGRSTLLLWWSFWLLPSFLSADLCWYALPLSLLTPVSHSFLLTSLWPQIQIQGLGTQSSFNFFTFSLGLCESECCSVVSDSLWSHGLYSPWDSPGKNTGVGSLSLLQGIFPTQELNPGLPHCKQILYRLSQKGSLGLCAPCLSSTEEAKRNKQGRQIWRITIHLKRQTDSMYNELWLLQWISVAISKKLQQWHLWIERTMKTSENQNKSTAATCFSLLGGLLR